MCVYVSVYVCVCVHVCGSGTVRASTLKRNEFLMEGVQLRVRVHVRVCACGRHVCMRVRVRAHLRACVHACARTFPCECADVFACACACAYACACTRACVRLCVIVYGYMSVCLSVRVCVCVSEKFLKPAGSRSQPLGRARPPPAGSLGLGPLSHRPPDYVHTLSRRCRLPSSSHAKCHEVDSATWLRRRAKSGRKLLGSEIMF